MNTQDVLTTPSISLGILDFLKESLPGPQLPQGELPRETPPPEQHWRKPATRLQREGAVVGTQPLVAFLSSGVTAAIPSRSGDSRQSGKILTQ